jgi:hypothetical protein
VRFPPLSLQDAKAYCREVVRILRTLKAKRDMSVNEARLIVAIEDPRSRERRQMDMEVGGCGCWLPMSHMSHTRSAAPPRCSCCHHYCCC